MEQRISILVDGKDGVDPESAAAIIDAVFLLLRRIDEASWMVGAPRVRWRVTEVSLVNPFNIVSSGTSMLPSDYDYKTPNFALDLVAVLKQLDSGTWPRIFSERDLKIARLIGKKAKENRRVEITGLNGQTSDRFEVNHSFSKTVGRLLRAPKRIRHEYGSIDGTLIALGNDPLKKEATAKIRDRFDQSETFCHAAPEVASRLGAHMDRTTRVVVYGTITYANDYPQQIQVEDFTAIPTDDKLPTLEAIHSLGLSLPGGMSPEEYLDDLRGEGDE